MVTDEGHETCEFLLFCWLRVVAGNQTFHQKVASDLGSFDQATWSRSNMPTALWDLEWRFYDMQYEHTNTNIIYDCVICVYIQYMWILSSFNVLQESGEMQCQTGSVEVSSFGFRMIPGFLSGLKLNNSKAIGQWAIFDRLSLRWRLGVTTRTVQPNGSFVHGPQTHGQLTLLVDASGELLESLPRQGLGKFFTIWKYKSTVLLES